MSYQVLARKYRPQSFQEVVGQEPIVTTLQNAVAGQRIHHAYLFSGLRGVGKTTVARLMAKALNCAEGPTPQPCNRCSSCAEIAESRSIDVLEIDGASNRGIDAVRELRETVRYSPSRDRTKVYIIDEVHMLTPEAWNALLKTLEEPPPHVVFLFATTDYRKIPLTILSRCQHFEFRKIAHADMVAHLRKVADGEKVSVPAGVVDLIARLAEGSLRDAQSALDQVIAFSGDALTEEQARTILGVIDRDLITDFFAAVRSGDCARLLEIIEAVFDKGYQPTQFLEDLMALGRDLLLARAVADPRRFLPGGPEEVEELIARAAPFSEDELLRLLELLTREEGRVRSSSHPRYLLEAMAIKMARLADLTPIEDLIARAGRTAAPADEGQRGPAPAAGGSSPAPSGRPDRRSSPGIEAAAGAQPSPGSDGAAAEPRTPPGAGADEPTRASRTAAASPADPALVESILKHVQETRGALGGFLAHAAWVEIADGALEIAFDARQSYFKEKVESRDNLDYLRAAARRVAGRDLAVRVVPASAAPGMPTAMPGMPAAAPGKPAAAPATAVAAPGTPAAAPGMTVAAPGATAAASGRPAAAPVSDESRRRLHEAALNEPIVKSLMETLGGQIVDVDQA